MSEQQTLIPNLNEIMEEYAEIAEETTLELHTTEVEQEVPDEGTKMEAQAEERRKIKMKEEREKKHGEEVNMDEFISYRAYEVMEKKMLRKDFIGKRGFNQFISLFKEVIEKRGWSLLCEHKSIG